MQSRFVSGALFGAGVLGLVCSVAAGVGASAVPNVPEIDAMSITTGLGLLSAGVLIVRARWQRK